MIVLIVVATLAAIFSFIIVAAGQPSKFSITRSASMAAPASAIFPHINDLQLWGAWSPWAKMDPACHYTFEGPAQGVGAISAWEGNKKVGAGRMTITESQPNELIRMRLEFFKPMKATNVAEFTLMPEGNGTLVTWTMSGINGFMGKAIGMLLNCEKMVGGQFAQGLASIKAIVEAK